MLVVNCDLKKDLQNLLGFHEEEVVGGANDWPMESQFGERVDSPSIELRVSYGCSISQSTIRIMVGWSWG